MAVRKKVTSSPSGNGNGVNTLIMLQTFEKMVQLQTQITINMESIVECIKDNTLCSRTNSETVKELIRSLSGLPDSIRGNRVLLRRLTYGFVPVVVSLVAIVLTLVIKVVVK